MKTDNFNEIIRRKLLGAEPPPYHEADWERMAAFMQSKHPPTFWQSYGQSFLYSSGIVAIVGLLIMNLTQLNENKRLLQEIKSASQQLAVRNQESKLRSQQFGVQKSEIRTVRAASSKSEIRSRESEARSRESEDGRQRFDEVAPVESAPAVSSLTESSMLSEVRGQKRTGSSVEIRNQKSEVEIEQSKIRTAGTALLNLEARSQKSEVRNQKPEIRNQKPEIRSQKSEIRSQSPEPDTRYSVLATARATPSNLEILQPTELSDLQTDLADGAKNKKLRVRTPDEMTWPTEPKKSEPVKLTTPWRVQTGVSSSFENHLTGAGLSAEVLIVKNWSLNVGLDVVKIAGEQFLSDEQFNQKHKQDFRNLYAPSQRVPVNADILNINSSLQIVRLPVFVSYRYPLKKDFMLLFSAGSAFDLSVKENISFNFRPNRQDFATETRNETRDFPVFNNLFGGLGIEKRWGHFAVQAQPYIGYKVAQMQPLNRDDRDNHPQMGIKLRALYRFGK